MPLQQPLQTNAPLECCDDASETSLAVVSLYNSWACDSPEDPDDDDNDDDESVAVALPVDYRQCLLKRNMDLPPVPRLIKRKRPNCRFLNFMGSRQHVQVPLPPTVTEEDDPLLCLFERDDPLFPLILPEHTQALALPVSTTATPMLPSNNLTIISNGTANTTTTTTTTANIMTKVQHAETRLERRGEL